MNNERVVRKCEAARDARHGARHPKSHTMGLYLENCKTTWENVLIISRSYRVVVVVIQSQDGIISCKSKTQVTGEFRSQVGLGWVKSSPKCYNT